MAEAFDLLPPVAAIGDGRYASLLGANLWGLLLITALFLLPVIVRHLTGNRERVLPV